MHSVKPLLKNDDVLIYDDSADPLCGRTREELLDAVSHILAGRVEEAYVFGSFTSDDFSKDSDIDLIIVTETHREFHKRHKDFPELYNLIPRLDLLIYTPEEFDRLKKTGSCGFWKSVFETARKIV